MLLGQKRSGEVLKRLQEGTRTYLLSGEIYALSGAYLFSESILFCPNGKIGLIQNILFHRLTHANTSETRPITHGEEIWGTFISSLVNIGFCKNTCRVTARSSTERPISTRRSCSSKQGRAESSSSFDFSPSDLWAKTCQAQIETPKVIQLHRLRVSNLVGDLVARYCGKRGQVRGVQGIMGSFCASAGHVGAGWVKLSKPHCFLKPGMMMPAT